MQLRKLTWMQPEAAEICSRKRAKFAQRSDRDRAETAPTSGLQLEARQPRWSQDCTEIAPRQVTYFEAMGSDARVLSFKLPLSPADVLRPHPLQTAQFGQMWCRAAPPRSRAD